MTTITGIDAAPSDVTITGAIPVTRIVPARPMTNAPHQFVSFSRPLALVVDLVRLRRHVFPSVRDWPVAGAL